MHGITIIVAKNELGKSIDNGFYLNTDLDTVQEAIDFRDDYGNKTFKDKMTLQNQDFLDINNFNKETRTRRLAEFAYIQHSPIDFKKPDGDRLKTGDKLKAFDKIRLKHISKIPLKMQKVVKLLHLRMLDVRDNPESVRHSPPSHKNVGFFKKLLSPSWLATK